VEAAALAQEIAASDAARWASSGAVYPVVNVVHLLGLVLLLGGIGVVDLRIAGAFTRLPLADLSRALTPVAAAGLAILLASGVVLFLADAPATLRSSTFRWKLVAIALALINAAAFHWWFARRDGSVTAAARVLALTSLGLWLAVATLGRMIAYS
jgi:hypothetical protein